MCFPARPPSQALEASAEQTTGSIIAGVSALIALEPDDSFAADVYQFKNEDSPDSDPDLYRSVAEFSLATSFSTFVPLFALALVYLTVEAPFASNSNAGIEIESIELVSDQGAESRP